MRSLKLNLFVQTLICGLLALFCAYFFLFAPPAKDLIYPLCCLTSALFLWTLVSWIRSSGHSFDLYTIFILATASFNGGQIFLEVFNLNSRGLLFGRFGETTLLETVLFVAVALASIHLGALFRLSKQEFIDSAGFLTRPPTALLQVGLLLLGLSVVPTFIVLKQMVDIVRTSGYFALYTRVDQIGIDNILTLISNFFVPGILFTMAGSYGKNKFLLATHFGIIVYGFLLIFLGRRGDGTEALVAYLVVYHYCVKPVHKKTVFAAAGIMLIVVFPLIAAIRNVDLSDRGDIGMMVGAYQAIDNPAVAVVSEMGGSMQAISHTIDLVPKFRPYDLGASYLYAALSVFPNLFWSIHPSVARGSPSVWLVRTVEPDIAALGGGLGYTYIAEAYFNFGWWGGPFALFLVGYALSSLVCWSQFSGDVLKIAAASTFFASLIGFARADSQSIIRPLFWYTLFPYLLVKWVEKRNIAKAAPV
ncbi:MAG: O-antigen polysaccharide polymerase Wzy [Cryobacterium sp.]|nr:O-antigen polysaccharide polymerase Wzy [Oligoflexia bacterium]